MLESTHLEHTSVSEPPIPPLCIAHSHSLGFIRGSKFSKSFKSDHFPVLLKKSSRRRTESKQTPLLGHKTLGNCLQLLSLPLPAPGLLADHMRPLFGPGMLRKPSSPGLCRLSSPPRRDVSPLLLWANLYTSFKTQLCFYLSHETGLQHFCLCTPWQSAYVTKSCSCTPSLLATWCGSRLRLTFHPPHHLEALK